MPKATFNNLTPKRQEAIRKILLEVFYNRHISQVKVSEIVAKMGMARGSFYKYFEDLEDAHSYIIKEAAQQVHQQILQEIYREDTDFFTGIANYLTRIADLDHSSEAWQLITLLTSSSDVFAKRPTNMTVDHPLVKQWQELLEKNQIHFATGEEALTFLFFVMDLVMNDITVFVVNHWSKEQLLQEYWQKVQWLKKGI